MPNVPTEEPEGSELPPEPMTFEDWTERVQKTFQLRDQDIPQPGDDWREAFDLGLTPVEFAEDLQGRLA